MDYKRHYMRLIERARCRTIEGYTERHHVIPRCMNGSNDSGNLVALTPEEHLVAHLLLAKMFPENTSIITAANLMSSFSALNSKKFGWVRRAFAAKMEGEGNPFYGKHHSKEALEKMHAPHGPMSEQFREYCRQRTGPSNSFYGKHHTPENIAKMAAIRSLHRGWKHTEETKRKMSASAKGRISPLRGRPQSEESKRKKSVAATLRWARERQKKADHATA